MEVFVYLSRCGLAVLTLSLTGCLERQPYLDSTTGAWAKGVVEQAEPGIRLGVGLAALAADLCVMDRESWGSSQPTKEDPTAGIYLSSDVKERLGIFLDGIPVTADTFTGVYSVAFSGGPVFDHTAVDFVVEATIPGQEIKVMVNYTDEDGYEQTFSDVSFQATECQTPFNKVAGTLSFYDEGMSDIKVAAPLSTGTAGYLQFLDGSTHFVSDTGSSALPWGLWDQDTATEDRPGGQVQWSGTSTVGVATLTTDDAAALDGTVWPALVAGSGWESDAEIDLE